MAYAPTHTNFGQDGTILGCFKHKETGAFFEFSMDFGSESSAFPHKVWVQDGYRQALVKKTVAYVIVGEDENGHLVQEKWDIKGFENYRAYHGLEPRQFNGGKF